MYFYVNSKLIRADVLVSYPGRPAAAASAGTNWLITGSDSRQGLTRAQEIAARDRQAQRDQRPAVRHDHDPAHPVERRAAGAGQHPA